MKIEILCRDGSPIGVTEDSIYGKDGRTGVGGAELALLTMCRAWHDAGHEVILYNDPNSYTGSVFTQRMVEDFHPHDNRDVLINFRSPSPDKIIHAKGLKVWWSCDQYTIDDYPAFAPMVDRIVTISPRHSEYFKTMYGISNTIPIDLPVRSWEYPETYEKIKNRCIFTSMPDRGLMQLHSMWPRIVEQVPDTSLVITSDWRLWSEWASREQIRGYELAFSMLTNVQYLGAINRTQLIEEQLKAEFHLYPAVYDELFCISVAESQVAGAWPITSGMGALATTNMGTVESGNPDDSNWQNMFIQSVVGAMLNREHPRAVQMRNELRQKAFERFSIESILKQWNEKIFDV